ncbi:MAG: hypothetical protein RIR18_397 [Pseudomonadota bacterium]|jgi:primosomal protein N' (replication factor Y)
MAGLVRVALDVPLNRLFDYRCADVEAADLGCRILVPFGTRQLVGVIVDLPTDTAYEAGQIRDAITILRELPPLPAEFLDLCRFASTYYQTPLGSALLQALPSGLKKTIAPNRRKSRQSKHAASHTASPRPILNVCQQEALEAIQVTKGFAPFLLYGITGSGKTEVYLHLIEHCLARGQQVLLMVPEINLTPQLEERVRGRFPDQCLAVLHSELTEAARERQWRQAFSGEAGIVLGTRLAVFTPMPALGLILIDEEHDASYKQQDGMRYSARDLAIYRAHTRQVPVVLGSATPSLESWLNAENGRYQRIDMLQRANPAARLPKVTLVDTRKQTLQEGLSEPVLAAIQDRLVRGEQSLVFLNRRGYAPVLSCTACGWISGCRRCAANLVVHLTDQRLRCHHCGFETRLPKACPTCGNQDVQAFGRGTQKVEAWLNEHFAGHRVLRVDRDVARSRKQWEALLAQIHEAEPANRAEILVGTQMLAKGHDFPNLTLVVAVGADAALFAADCRAPERLFAQLMQVAGRAGRAELPGEVIIQTQYPDHPLYAALVAHDFPGFAKALLAERRQAGFPPYTFQAILRAEAPNMATALAFLEQLSCPEAVGDLLSEYPDVLLYDAIPMRMARLANLERGQILVESTTRSQLQAFLQRWRSVIESHKLPSRLRWHLEVDPLEY